MEALEIAVRLAQYAGLLTLLGLLAFPVYAKGAPPVLGAGGLRVLALFALGASAASLLVLSARMGDAPSAAIDPSTLWAVVSGMGAGRAGAVRMAALVVCAGITGRRGPSLGFAGIAAGSLAWTGHAAAEADALGLLRQAADVLHLLASAVWIGALVSLWSLARGSADTSNLTRSLTAFSGIGSGVVAILIASGLVNAAPLVDWRKLSHLTASPWGALLIVKLALFVAMLGLAAVNRFWLTPRLVAGMPARRDLLVSLLLETALAVAVVAVVSALGIQTPPMAV